MSIEIKELNIKTELIIDSNQNEIIDEVKKNIVQIIRNEIELLKKREVPKVSDR